MNITATKFCLLASNSDEDDDEFGESAFYMPMRDGVMTFLLFTSLDRAIGWADSNNPKLEPREIDSMSLAAVLKPLKPGNVCIDPDNGESRTASIEDYLNAVNA